MTYRRQAGVSWFERSSLPCDTIHFTIEKGGKWGVECSSISDSRNYSSAEEMYHDLRVNNGKHSDHATQNFKLNTLMLSHQWIRPCVLLCECQPQGTWFHLVFFYGGCFWYPLKSCQNWQTPWLVINNHECNSMISVDHRW